MPKPLKKKRNPPKDINQWARHLVQVSTAESETEEPPTIAPAVLSAYMSVLGRKGGKVSGRRRMQNLSAEQRQEIAANAARARWARAAKTRTRKT